MATVIMLSVMGLLLHGVRQAAAYRADMNRSTKLPFCPLGTSAGPRPARRRRVQAGRAAAADPEAHVLRHLF
jgi:hypothetical protein